MTLTRLICLMLLLALRPVGAQVDAYNQVSRSTFLDTVIYNCECYAVHSGTLIECAVFCSIPMIPERPRCFGLAVEHENYCCICGKNSTGSFEADEIHYDDVIMDAIASQITSLASVYSDVWLDGHQKNIKAPRHWPLCVEFTGDRWIPAQMASNAENVSIWWRHHDPRMPRSGFNTVSI